MESIDVAVIGAGWFGLAAAKTYLELHPTANLVLFDAYETVGGTWSKERLYPGLITNNMLGMLEYPDFPMDTATYGVKPGQHIPGLVVHQYLTNYAKKFGLYDRIRFNTKVSSVRPAGDDKWILSTTGSTDPTKDKAQQIRADKLIVSTGLTSEPHMPKLPGAASFQAPILHAREALSLSDTVKTAHRVVILGSGKSAYDVAYAHATAGVEVDMIVHKSGRGPAWIAPIYVTPFKRWIEKLVTTRLLSWFSPCVWGKEDGYGTIRSYLHRTAIGRFIVEKFWNVLTQDLVTLNGYDTHPAMKLLKPWHSAYYEGTQLSINNYPTNVFDFVRSGKIKVHVADVTDLSQNTVHLSTGESLQTDALICCTGWKYKPLVTFEGFSDQELGLPYSSAETEALVEKANKEVLRQYPSLETQPPIKHSDLDGLNHPYRLYRFMVPPALFAKRNLVFAGALAGVSTSFFSAMQALWISVYFDGKLDRRPSNEEEAKWEAVLHTQCLAKRYPLGHGAQHPDFVFDIMPYMDLLLGDLGLNKWRKSNRLAEFTVGYGPEDYRDIVDEWKEKHGWMEKA